METFQEFSWLENYAPVFRMQGNNVKVVSDPRQFYLILKERTRVAKRRIVMASLYLGTGVLEKQLVDCIQEALNDSGELKVRFLFDFSRGSRGASNSRTALQPLVSSHPDDVTVSFYHTPDLRGALRLLLPGRCNEIVGLAHMKVYVVDDTAIISGANLSSDYFNDRQDRYVVLEHKGIADFFEELVHTVSSFSFRLEGDGSVTLPSECTVHPYLGNRKQFVEEAKRRVDELLDKWHAIGQHAKDTGDTWVYPLVQMGPLGVTRDSDATSRFLRTTAKDFHVHLATGYFNLTESYQRDVLRPTGPSFSILVAHPRANGFFGAQDLSGLVPHVYTYLAKLFFSRISGSRVTLMEYERPGWTFHAKGLWCGLPGEVLPSMTFVGSPNFGYRSVYRDLEAQLAIVTENEGLRTQLLEERQRLYGRSTAVTAETFCRPERRVPFLARIIAKITRHFF